MVAWQVGTNQVPFSASEHQNGQRPDETNRPFERISYGHPTLKWSDCIADSFDA